MKSSQSTLVFLTALLLLFAAGEGWAGERTSGDEVQRLHGEGLRLLQSKKFDEAIRKFGEILKKNPDDMIAYYNLACAYSLKGEKERAVTALVRSVMKGYSGFDHMESDPDLDPIREMVGYKRILVNREIYSRIAEHERELKYRVQLGKRYTFKKDPKTKVLFVTNLDDRSRDELMNTLRRYAEALWRDFFKIKPQYMITVLVPATPKDYIDDFLGGRRVRRVAGFYNHGSRTLTVNIATGTGTMTHEWTHALHHGDMAGLKQRHPGWIVEGFGSLYEGCTIRRDGTAVGMMNWRLWGLQPVLRQNSKAYLPWKKLMDPKSGVFRPGSRSIGMAYAVARYIFYYMQEKKVLRKFYRIYRERFKEDPTGKKFVEEVFGKKIDEIEAEWKPWVLKLHYPRPPGMGRRPQLKVRLGVMLDATETGVAVSEVTPDSCAEKAGLQAGDVILEADGKPVKRTMDLLNVLSGKNPGDPIRLKIRRGDKEIEVEGKLQKR
ncbi:MAG: PDZ domain-containing protein [Planctomycetota bacterium]|jgi:tetratricopeptide (TPR) repeat protein